MNFENILLKQNTFKQKTGRYFQVIKDRTKNPKETEVIDMTDIDLGIEIHEHKCPNGETGFTILEKQLVDGVEQIKATGSGCGSSTFDWRIIETI